MNTRRKHKLKVNYCIRLWLLQEIAGCTFVEGRLFLKDERKESIETICNEHRLEISEGEKLLESAKKKVSDIGEDRIFHGYTAIYPNEEDDTNWRWCPIRAYTNP